MTRLLTVLENLKWYWDCFRYYFRTPTPSERRRWGETHVTPVKHQKILYRYETCPLCGPETDEDGRCPDCGDLFWHE